MHMIMYEIIQLTILPYLISTMSMPYCTKLHLITYSSIVIAVT